MAHHRVEAGPATCQWGYLDAVSPPVLKIASGDSVTVETVSGQPGFIPERGAFDVPQALLDIHRDVKQGPGPHILTGPVFVEGATPGKVLEVRIDDVTCTTNWGTNTIRPLSGALPYEFPRVRSLTIPLDLEKQIAKLPWGLDLPLKPFFGIMGVAPPKAWGRVSSIQPRAFGGNLDNKELVAGTILYLPVFEEGALFTCGDGHGAQGDGEVNVNAIESSLRGTFTLIARNDLELIYPRAETPTHYITMGMDPDLDQCAQMALRDMIALLSEKSGLSREDAYTLCSLAGDLRVTQIVNGNKGVHMMMEKKLVHLGPA